MEDLIRMEDVAKDLHAEGFYRVELWDPRTRKIKERVEGKNYVWTDLLYNGYSGSLWGTCNSSLILALCDSDLEVDANWPFVMGTPIGYGKPSAAGSSTYRGAYNAAKQLLAYLTDQTSIKWKFVYDFTTAQANGTIKNIGLTHQYTGYYRSPLKMWQPGATSTTYNGCTCDGRYSYSCSLAGIVTIFDGWNGTTSTVDVSAIVGTSTGTTKYVGYAPSTGHYYIWCYSATTGNRKMYEFASNAFAAAINTYSPTNITHNSVCGIYVYGTVMYCMQGSDTLATYDFSANTVGTTYQLSPNCVSVTESHATAARLDYNSMAYGTYIICIPASSTTKYCGGIFDMATNAWIAHTAGLSTCNTGLTHHPAYTNKVPCINEQPPRATTAICAQVLGSPVVKTSSYGMTATYELTVAWN